LTDSMYFTFQKVQDAARQAGEMRDTFAISDTLKRQAISVLLDAPAPPDTSRRGAPAAAPPNPAAAVPTPPPTPAPTPPTSPTPAVPGPNTLRGAATSLSAVLNTLQAADVPVTATQRASIAAALRDANGALARWNAYRA